MRGEESQRRKRLPRSQQRTALKNDRNGGWEEKGEGNAKSVICGSDICIRGRGAILNATPFHISPRLAPIIQSGLAHRRGGS